jgi:pyruvate, orthophosphate dikinase
VKAEAADNLLLFLQKIIRDSGSDLEEFLPILDTAFRRIHDYDGETFQLFVWSYYQIRKLAQGLSSRGIRLDGRVEAINRLLLKYSRYTFSYWLGEVDPLEWYESEAEEAGGISGPEAIFSEISHRRIRELANRVEKIAGTIEIDRLK